MAHEILCMMGPLDLGPSYSGFHGSKFVFFPVSRKWVQSARSDKDHRVWVPEPFSHVSLTLPNDLDEEDETPSFDSGSGIEENTRLWTIVSFSWNAATQLVRSLGRAETFCGKYRPVLGTDPNKTSYGVRPVLLVGSSSQNIRLWGDIWAGFPCLFLGFLNF